MKKTLGLLLLTLLFINSVKSQVCNTGGCSNSTNPYPTGTFTPTTTWTPLSSFMNGGNYTLFNVSCGLTYDWTYCETYGGVSTAWDAQLTLYNNSSNALLCYSDDDCGATAPYIRWTANFTGTVRLLTNVYNCSTNGPSGPWNKLVYKISNAPTSTVTITTYNFNSTVRSNARVKLYNYNYTQVLGEGYTNGSGQIPFTIPSGSYNYEVYYTPSGVNSPISPYEEFWGSQAFSFCSAGQSIPSSFVRIQPYISSAPSFSPTALTIGQTTNGSFSVRNGLQYATPSYVAVWIDRNQSSPWDYNSTTSSQSIGSGATASFSFNNIAPANTGIYKYYAFVYSFVNSSYQITDQYAWTNAFTTTCPFLAEPTSPTPGTASAPGPVLSSLTPTFYWNGNSSGNYHVQIWNASTNPTTPNNVIYGFETPGSPGYCVFGLSHPIPPGVLVNNGQYKWSVHRNDPCGECESNPTIPLYFQINTNPCSPPTTQVNNITFSSVDVDRFTVQWNNGNGSKRIIKVNTTNSFSNPVNGVDPGANAVYQNSGEQVVYNNSSGTSVTVTGLSPNSTYWVRAYEANCTGSSIVYNTNTASGNPNSQATTPLPAVANFYSPTPIIVAGQTAQFYDQSLNATSLSWLVEREQWNGSYTAVSSSTQQNPSFQFNTAACYKITLTATNAAGSNSLARQCYIYAKPDLNSPIPADVTRAQNYYTYKGGDPINLANGSFSFSMKDFSIPGVKSLLNLERRYFSNSNYAGVFGTGWHHSFDIKVDFSNAFDWSVQYPDGHNEHFAPYPNGETRSLYPGNFDTLFYTSSGGIPTAFTHIQKDGMRWNFNGSGQIISSVDLDGNQTLFSYAGGKLSTVTLPGGRTLSFTYNGFNKVETVTDNINRTAFYYYDVTGQKLDSTRIGVSTTSFRYDIYGMTEVYDPRGNRIVQNFYNPQGQVYEQKDAESKITSFQYNTPIAGATTVTDPLLKIKITQHDAKSRCVEVKDELNNIVKYSYSLNNTMDTILDARSFKTTINYDAKGNPIKNINAKGFSDSIAYTGLNKPNYIRDKELNVYKTLYSSTGNPTAIILPTGDTLKREYNNRGLDTAVIDARGFRTRKLYNNNGDLVQTITPTSVTSIVYDAVGRPVEITDSYGRKDSIFWNYFDLVIKRKDKMGRVEEFGYDENGNQVFYKDKKGQITTTQYNTHDKPVKIIEPQNHITDYEYDDNQRVKKIRDPNKNTLIFNYDDAGRLLSIADSVLGTLTQKTYDANSNVITYSDALNKIWTNRVDEINRITSTVNPLGDSIQYRYNKNNQPTEQIDEEGKSSKWEYDAAGRHIKSIDARNNYVQRFLNKNGLTDSIRDARGNFRNKATYDGSDRLLTLNDGFGNYSMTWDSSGNVKTITDPDNRTKDYFYNNNNELLDVKIGSNTLRHYLLDNNGQFLEANSGNQNAAVIRNQLGLITQYTDNYSNTTERIYDSIGNAKKIIYPGGKQVEYKYNSLNKCVEVKDWTNGIFTISRNNNGDITSILYSNNFKTETTRDDASRIKAWVNKTNTDSVFQSNLISRNKTGNILKDSGISILSFTPLAQVSVGTYGNDDRMLTYGNNSITSDNSGQRLQLTAPSKSFSYTWSPSTELVSTNHTGAVQASEFDAFNERVTKTKPTGTTRYIVDHYLAPFPVVLQERDGANQELINYLFIPGEGILLARDSMGTMIFYHHDVKGNTIALSNSIGQITDRYNYNEFGDSIYHSGAITQPFTWMGMYGVQHDGYGLYYLHARCYDGTTGTFISKDPYPINYLNTQNVNRYVYGYNNPLKYIDPTGLVAHNNISYDDPVFLSRLDPKDKVFTMEQFLWGNQGLNFMSIILQRKTQYMIVPGGPEMRYVINPNDNTIMDMRHVMVVGSLVGTGIGSLLEKAQQFFNKSSALNPMDYYSNQIGKDFRDFLGDHPTINVQDDWAMIFYLWIKGKYAN